MSWLPTNVGALPLMPTENEDSNPRCYVRGLRGSNFVIINSTWYPLRPKYGIGLLYFRPYLDWGLFYTIILYLQPVSLS